MHRSSPGQVDPAVPPTSQSTYRYQEHRLCCFRASSGNTCRLDRMGLITWRHGRWSVSVIPAWRLRNCAWALGNRVVSLLLQLCHRLHRQVANLAGRDGGSGWGLKSESDAPAGTKLLELPSSCHLTYSTADSAKLLKLIDQVPTELWGAKLALQVSRPPHKGS